MTGCARFLIFLLIFTPIVLIGVSIYNGNNPIDQVKDLLNIESVERPADSQNTSDNNSDEVSADAILQSTINAQKDEIENLKKEVEDLRNTLTERDKEILHLKQQLGNE